MKRTISFLATLMFGFVLAFGLVVNSASADTVQCNPLDNFRVINVQEFIKNNQIKATNPKAVSAQFFSSSVEEEEGRRSEDISVTYHPAMERASILYTIEGLPDDSVNSIRHRIELKSNQNKWEIVWVGQQNKCQIGRGDRDWSTSLCS
jgi:hypothetical protein